MGAVVFVSGDKYLLQCQRYASTQPHIHKSLANIGHLLVSQCYRCGEGKLACHLEIYIKPMLTCQQKSDIIFVIQCACASLGVPLSALHLSYVTLKPSLQNARAEPMMTCQPTADASCASYPVPMRHPSARLCYGHPPLKCRICVLYR